MKKYLLPLILLILAVQACEKPDDGITIAVSKSSGGVHYERYSEWIAELCPEAEIIDLSDMTPSEAEIILKRCDGLVLSGGPDVHPGRFGKQADTGRCYIDERRDTLEFAAAEFALLHKMPILAVCRGEQLLNVVLGGSLVIDLPEDRLTVIHRNDSNSNALHDIFIKKGTRFLDIVGTDQGTVNTNHHQAVDRLADELTATAFTLPDSIIEAFEWKNPEGKSPMIAVQWHPERLDTSNVFSKNIGHKFIEAVKIYSDTSQSYPIGELPE